MPAPLHRAGFVQAQCRPDQGEMRKCLREIANLPPRTGIILFRKQANIVAKRQQALEYGASFGGASLEIVGVGQPEAAGEKGAFSRRQTVDVGLGAITQYEAIA